MKFSKGQGISLFAALIVFGIFNTIVFLAGVPNTVAFWLGYFFAFFGLVTIALTLMLYFGKSVKEDKFLSLPPVKVAWTYFILQTALSIWEIVYFPYPYLLALTINLVVGVVFAIIILSLYAAAEKIDKAEQFTAEKVLFIKELKLKLDCAEVNDPELEKNIKELAEEIRFSDQMSHSKLAEIEGELDETVDMLVESIEDTEKAAALCDKASKLLKKRNQQCKMYKGVKDEAAAQAQKTEKGLGIPFAGACVMSVMLLTALAVCFIIAPMLRYNEAVALTKQKSYADAVNVFTSLGNYRDSKAQIEHIHNMLEEDKYVYFGMYKGKAIAWTILRTEKDKMLLIADTPVDMLSFNNDLENITWEESDIRTWLNGEFLKEFSKEQRERILTNVNDEISDEIFLISGDEYNKYHSAALNTEIEDWWTRTKTDAGMMFVDGETGELNTDGEGVVRGLGIRPCVWVILK